MPVTRGSTAKIIAIKETVPGTTPATPTMLELPEVSFAPSFDNGVIKSAQIRSHPYVDKMMQGRFSASFGMDVELQGSTHDILYETMFGGSITTKSLPFADVLKTLTVEEQVGGGSSLFDQYTYMFFTSMSISCGAEDDSPVKVSFQGMARNATLDAAATVSSVITPAGNPDPFTFIGASATIAGAAVAVTSGSINFERAVDPLYVWGSRFAREYVPGAVTVSGSITVPYDGATQSAQFTAFADNAMVFKFGLPDLSVYRQFTLPKTKILTLAREIQDRGARMQELTWEAKYDPTSTTVCTMTTE